MSSSLVVVIPAYNEAENIAECISRLWTTALPFAINRIIVVDDGSADETAAICRELAKDLPLELVAHRTNLGVGAAFCNGFSSALESAGHKDFIVTMEADKTGDLAILAAMLEHADSGQDVVLASCYAPGGGIVGSTPLRMFLSKSANILLRIAYPHLKIHTYSSFYRVYRAEVLRAALDAYGERFIEQPGFECMVEVLVKLSRLTSSIVEVPMTLRADERIGSSKMRIVRTILGYVQFILSDTKRRLTG